MCHIVGKVKRVINGQEVEVTLCESTLDAQERHRQQLYQSPEYLAYMNRKRAPETVWEKSHSGEHSNIPGAPEGFSVMQVKPKKGLPLSNAELSGYMAKPTRLQRERGGKRAGRG
jgi:hypothetical protein